MRLAALVTEQTRQAWAEECWLASLDWTFLSSAAEAAVVHPDLLIVEAVDQSAPWPKGGFGCPSWVFGVAGAHWDVPECVDVFERPLDLRGLSERLLAWMWVTGQVSPACFAGLDLTLANGRLSFASSGRSLCPMQMSVRPSADVGGDVALYYQDCSRILVVLADAIGHGEEAALDAAQFVLAVVRHLVPSTLSPPALRNLCASLTDCLTRGRFVAAAALDLDLRHGRVALINAGMPDVLRLRHGDPEAFFPSRQPPLGLGGVSDPIILSMSLEADTQWVLCSDGVDGTALRHTLKTLHAQLDDSPIGLEAMLAESIVPLHPSGDADDDASQIILCIPS
jgi:hypothetical protein